MTKPIAIILGASGSVGQALLAEITLPGRFAQVIVVGRQALGLARLGSAVTECVVTDMDGPRLTQAVVGALADLDGPVVGFSVLGIGAGTARLTLEEHRAVDVGLNAAFAAGLHASGKVDQLVFMSALGANPRAKATGSGAAGMPRYARVKGEAEQAVQANGPQIVSIVRPFVIVGSPHTPAALAVALKLLSPLLPSAYRPISTQEIARAMVSLALKPPRESRAYAFTEMRALAGELHAL